MTEGNITNRIPNYEILRVIAMLSIVFLHSTGWGMFFASQPVYFNCTNGFFYPLLSSIASIGVDLFILISGYFLSTNQRFKYDKILIVWFQVLFYSLIIAIIFASCGKLPLRETVTYIFPIRNDLYWFVTKYIGFLLLAPFLSRFVSVLSKKEFYILFFVLLFVIVTITQGIPYGDIFVVGVSQSLMLFMSLFCVAAYIRKYDVPLWVQRNVGKILIGLLLIQWGGGIMINLCSQTGFQYGGFSISYNGLTLFTSTAFFLWFKNLKMPNTKCVHFLLRIAPLTFGVYLIHDHPLIRPWLWSQIDLSKYWSTPYYIPYLIFACLSIFFICILIDWVRAKLFDLLNVNIVIEKSMQPVKQKFLALIQKIANK